MNTLNLGANKIFLGEFRGSARYELVNTESAMPDVEFGQVLVYDGSNLVKADASTDKESKTYIADEKWNDGNNGDIGVWNRASGSYELLSTDKRYHDSFYYKITDEADFVSNDKVNTKCGLDATGTKLDVNNPIELVEIIGIHDTKQGQKVFFTFLR